MIVIGKRGDANHSIGQFLFGVVKVVVRRADHTGAYIAKVVFRWPPVEFFRVIVEYNRPVIAKFFRFAVEDRNAFDKSQLATLPLIDLADIFA